MPETPQFFSKVTTTNNNNAKETIEVPNKEQGYVTKQEQEPSFIPDTQNGYGIYGHESGQFPPTTTKTTTALPYTTPNNNNNNYYYHNEAYVSDPQGMSDTRFIGKAYTTTAAAANNNNDNNNYYNGANNYYNTQQQPNNYYNTQKQGMSDTRYLENGKYYYDGNVKGYNKKGYYGNFNENSYEQYQNSMEGYQQQNQEEFQEREEEYVP
ncbi:hypothetical protein Acr_00g0101550 [Actinidia rufa]|uniref:Uncharacterized protein n=1 Tax=Actinidia rufa TaxID=165716 RepID=A0A7J0E0G3_9ERIC|nr:hypothetical protein Acr_00g0101550 [Actinidia rufa]